MIDDLKISTAIEDVGLHKLKKISKGIYSKLEEVFKIASLKVGVACYLEPKATVVAGPKRGYRPFKWLGLRWPLVVIEGVSPYSLHPSSSRSIIFSFIAYICFFLMI